MMDDIVEAFSTVFGRLMGHISAEWVHANLSTAQLKVIFVLHFGGAHTPNQLAERLAIETATVVDPLVEMGLAMRIERQTLEVHLTEQGHSLAERLSGSRQQWIVATWVSQLTAEQRAAFRTSLRALLPITENSPRRDL